MGYILASAILTLGASGDGSQPASARAECFHILCWRWPFIVEAFLIFPLYIGFYFVPAAHIQANTPSPPSTASRQRHLARQSQQKHANFLRESSTFPAAHDGAPSHGAAVGGVRGIEVDRADMEAGKAGPTSPLLTGGGSFQTRYDWTGEDCFDSAFRTF